MLGIFHNTRHRLTAQGEAARVDLQQWLDAGRERFASWTVSDAQQALAYAGAAGAVLLLMPSLFPELRRLREQLPDSTTADDDRLFDSVVEKRVSKRPIRIWHHGGVLWR